MKNNISGVDCQPVAMGVIYLITCRINGKPYVGKTKRSLETRAKLSAALKGRPAHNKGVKHTPEARAKMSAAQKAIGNIPPNHKGKKRGPRSPETKAKLSAANKGKHPSEETLAKMSAAQKARWAKKKAVENGGK